MIKFENVNVTMQGKRILSDKMCIRDREKEVQEIAASVGYENPGKFSSAFRSVMGLSPAEYLSLIHIYPVWDFHSA